MGRRLKYLQISDVIFAGIFTAGRRDIEVYQDPMPDDARAVDVMASPTPGMFLVLFESESFEEVAEGATPPEIRPMFRQHYPRDITNPSSN